MQIAVKSLIQSPHLTDTRADKSVLLCFGSVVVMNLACDKPYSSSVLLSQTSQNGMQGKVQVSAVDSRAQEMQFILVLLSERARGDEQQHIMVCMFMA
jgi:hypothetical protein